LPRELTLTVVGSINLDLVSKVERLPRPGETVSGATLERVPGGKGANQAVAAARLGANVRMVGCVGADPYAEEALAGLRAAGVLLEVREVDPPTGVAIILVADDGENVIVVVPGANAHVGGFTVGGNVLCQLEIPDEAVQEARAQAEWLCVNAAPARPLLVEADLVVANGYEAEFVGDQPLLAVTMGEEGAVLLDHGKEIARARPPSWWPSTGPPPAMRSPPASPSRCSKAATPKKPCAARARQARSPQRSLERSPRCRPQTT
jgi:ribokinase